MILWFEDSHYNQIYLSSANCALEGELLHFSFFNVVNPYLLSICILHLTLIMKTIPNCITMLKICCTNSSSTLDVLGKVNELGLRTTKATNCVQAAGTILQNNSPMSLLPRTLEPLTPQLIDTNNTERPVKCVEFFICPQFVEHS